jgi:trans-2,3-dihydro-3-hydroxyanthranilate isomerase
MAGREYRFVQVDVFTDQIFRGNPLAVVLDAQGISDAEMQAIAREMNLSETTFVLPATRPDCVARVRIFTPGSELPFAGHPTIGTGFVLAQERRLPQGAASFVLEEAIGPVPVRFEGDPSAPSFTWMQHGEATFGPPIENRAAVAEALGLSEADLLEGCPIQSGSTGVSFLYVPLCDREAVAANVPASRELPVFAFAPDPDPTAGRVYSRMFGSDLIGIPEDPATGSASGPLGAYLVQNRLVRREEETRIVSEQGTKMGRQSFIHIRLRTSGDQITSIEVGGSAVPVLDGTLRLR